VPTLLPLLAFIVVGTVTPGPNNLMVLASGANWGLRRTLPHIAGIAFGFPVMILAVGLGLSVVFTTFPWLHEVLKWAAFAYLCFLALRIALAGRPGTADASARPMSFLEAAAFQWVNPKAWALVISGLALFAAAEGNKVVETGVIAVLFGLVCLPNGVAWGLFGGAIAGFLADDRRRLQFNVAMAVLLVLSAIPTLF